VSDATTTPHVPGPCIYGGPATGLLSCISLIVGPATPAGIALLLLGVVVAVLVLMQLMGVSKHTHKKAR